MIPDPVHPTLSDRCLYSPWTSLLLVWLPYRPRTTERVPAAVWQADLLTLAECRTWPLLPNFSPSHGVGPPCWTFSKLNVSYNEVKLFLVGKDIHKSKHQSVEGNIGYDGSASYWVILILPATTLKCSPSAPSMSENRVWREGVMNALSGLEVWIPAISSPRDRNPNYSAAMSWIKTI